MSGPRSEAGTGSYGRGAAVLSVGIGVTGLVTYTYFGLASHTLSEDDYGRISLLWSAIFIIVSVLYRPVEQLLSRTIADHDARGIGGTHHLRVAATIQLALALAYAVGALALRGPIEDDLFDGETALYWIFIVTVLAYAASYFARGFLAGHHRFGLYGGLVLLESTSRCMFAVLAAVGITSGQDAVALGMVAAPFASLLVVPWAIGRRLRRLEAADPSRELDAAAQGEPAKETEFTLTRGGGFAAAVLVIMLAEQTFLNAGPLVVKATEGARGSALAGFAFNVLLIARAPLQLFQAIQTSILPHLTKARAGGQQDTFRRSVNVTLAAIAAFAAAVALVMLALGPWLMGVFFGGEFDYDRLGLVLISLGMGLYLAAATLNQAALARARAREAALGWIACALLFVGLLLVPGFDDRIVQLELAYVAGALVLCAYLALLYRRGD